VANRHMARTSPPQAAGVIERLLDDALALTHATGAAPAACDQDGGRAALVQLLPGLLPHVPRVVAEDLVKHNISRPSRRLWKVLCERNWKSTPTPSLAASASTSSTALATPPPPIWKPAIGVHSHLDERLCPVGYDDAGGELAPHQRSEVVGAAGLQVTICPAFATVGRRPTGDGDDKKGEP
jgi:hypothetical protein